MGDRFGYTVETVIIFGVVMRDTHGRETVRKAQHNHCQFRNT